MKYTLNHKVEDPYIDYLLKEWALYRQLFDEKPRIAELHLGGGTPTFFSPENLKRLIDGIFKDAELVRDAKLSLEASPHSTTETHLQVLHALGFRRLSLGVQDFDPAVQLAINRIQSPEMVAEVVGNARRIGFDSINFDLIYGLPKQTTDSITATFKEVIKMRPERIAYYSYAHVPWIKGIQRKFTEADLPQDQAKRALYELGKGLLEATGYEEIGMDHFALPEDELFLAGKTGHLHRNFMGYTAHKTELLIGLGSSAISDTWNAFMQNEKSISKYFSRLDEGQFPILRGHQLSREDLIIRKHILNIMCRFETEWKNEIDQPEAVYNALYHLSEPEIDGLVELHNFGVRVKPKGKAFIRNVCMAFDAKLQANKPNEKLFSATV